MFNSYTQEEIKKEWNKNKIDCNYIVINKRVDYSGNDITESPIYGAQFISDAKFPKETIFMKVDLW